MDKKKRISLTLLLLIFVTAGFLTAQDKALFKAEKVIDGTAVKTAEVNSISFTVYKDREQVYSVNKNVAYDVPLPDFRLFGDGSGVLIDAFEATLTFYKASGDETAHLDIMKEKNISYERSVYSAVAGKSLVIALQQPGIDELSIQYYNNDGQFNQQFRVNRKQLNGICLSDNANIIALSVYDWQQDKLIRSTLFFDLTGRQLAGIQTGFTKGSFSEEGDFFIGYSNRDCFSYDLNERTINFSKSSQKEMMILDAQLNNEQIIIIEAEKPFLKNGKWYYQNPRLEIYGLNGRLLRKATIESRSFSEFELNSTKEGLIFRTENTTHQLVN